MKRLLKMIWHWVNGPYVPHQCEELNWPRAGVDLGRYCQRAKFHYGKHKDCCGVEWE